MLFLVKPPLIWARDHHRLITVGGPQVRILHQAGCARKGIWCENTSESRFGTCSTGPTTSGTSRRLCCSDAWAGHISYWRYRFSYPSKTASYPIIVPIVCPTLLIGFPLSHFSFRIWIKSSLDHKSRKVHKLITPLHMNSQAFIFKTWMFLLDPGNTSLTKNKLTETTLVSLFLTDDVILTAVKLNLNRNLLRRCLERLPTVCSGKE